MTEDLKKELGIVNNRISELRKALKVEEEKKKKLLFEIGKAGKPDLFKGGEFKVILRDMRGLKGKHVFQYDVNSQTSFRDLLLMVFHEVSILSPESHTSHEIPQDEDFESTILSFRKSFRANCTGLGFVFCGKKVEGKEGDGTILDFIQKNGSVEEIKMNGIEIHFLRFYSP